MAKVVTFYSYKGGTGRSMALANVAWILASNGRRVLTVDWDLEAPGLHRYFWPFLTDKELTGHESQGLIDLMVDFSVRLATPQARSDQLWYTSYADIRKWSKRLQWPSGEQARMGLNGCIDFVPAGRQDTQYAKRVNSFDWANFYERLNGGAFVDALRQSMERYDWALIDSRTGVSDTSGICTLQLPDILVVCFTLNYQSITGAASVALSVKSQRPNIRILPVPMRIDGSEDKLLRRMKANATAVFDPVLDADINRDEYWYLMEVPYFARYAYSEKLAPFEDQGGISTSTLPSMERLTSYITNKSVTNLVHLPEEQRKAALQQFERDPVQSQQRLDSEAPKRLYTFLSQVGKWLERLQDTFISGTVFRRIIATLVPSLLLVSILSSRIVSYLTDHGDSAKITEELLAGARRDLATDQPELHDHAAVLIAEAARQAGRTGTPAYPDSVVSKNIFDALMSLSPLRVGTTQHAAAVRIVRVNPDGRLVATASDDKQCHVFYSDGGGPPWTAPKECSGWAVAFSPDGKYLATGGTRGRSSIYDVQLRRELYHIQQKGSVKSLLFSPNGKVVVAGTDTGEIAVYGISPWRELVTIPNPGGVFSLAYSPDSLYFAVATTQSTTRVFTYQDQVHNPAQATASLPPRLQCSRAFVGRIPFTLIPARVAAPTSSTRYSTVVVQLADFSVGRPERTFAELVTRRSANGTYSSRGSLVESLSGHFGAVRAVAFAPTTHPRRLVTGSDDGTARLWTQTADVPNSMVLHVGAAVYTVAFSPQGDLLATGSLDGTARLWSVPDGKEIRRMQHQGDVRALAFSSDGSWLATGSGDGTARIWDVSTAQELQRINFVREVNSVAFTPDRKYLVTGGSDGQASAWLIVPRKQERSLSVRETTFLACSQVSSRIQLSAAEWRQYYGSQSYDPVCKLSELAKH